MIQKYHSSQLSNEAYHARAGLSSSGVRAFMRSPAHYEVYKNSSSDSDALRNGSLLHAMILEPETVDTDFAVAPNVDRRTKAGKEAYQEFVESSKDKTIIKPDDFNRIEEAVFEFNRSEYAKLLTGGNAEMSFFSNINGVTVKARPDYIYIDHLGVATVYDVKSTRSAHEDEFARSAYKYSYHIQAAFYKLVLESLGYTVADFIFLAIESNAPFGVNPFRFSNETMEKATFEVNKAIQDFKNCKDFSVAYPYRSEPITI